MTAKKKKAKASARKPRPAPRGMYLTVHCYDKAGLSERVRISSFMDITRLGHKIAGAVRAYLRSVPMLPHVPAYGLTVYPSWTPTAAAPVRKSQAEDGGGALDLEDNDGG